MESLCENNEHNFSVKFLMPLIIELEAFVMSFRAVSAMVPAFLSGIFH